MVTKHSSCAKRLYVGGRCRWGPKTCTARTRRSYRRHSQTVPVRGPAAELIESRKVESCAALSLTGIRWCTLIGVLQMPQAEKVRGMSMADRTSEWLGSKLSGAWGRRWHSLNVCDGLEISLGRLQTSILATDPLVATTIEGLSCCASSAKWSLSSTPITRNRLFETHRDRHASAQPDSPNTADIVDNYVNRRRSVERDIKELSHHLGVSRLKRILR